MQDVIELAPDQFTQARLSEVVSAISAEMGLSGYGLNSLGSVESAFYTRWQELMRLGVARAWESPGRGVLLALFVKDVFSGKLRASVPLWAVLPRFRGTKPNAAEQLFKAFEHAAKLAGCVDISGASHSFCPRDRAWLENGFWKVETIFSKNL